MLLTRMVANLNEDDDAYVAYDEARRQQATSKINTLESTEVSIKIYKHRQREAAHARLWKEYFAENPVYQETDFWR